MTERRPIYLSKLPTGATIIARAGSYRYDLHITESGEEPSAVLTQYGPDGRTVTPQNVIIRGTGVWTTPSQNPMQLGTPGQSEKALTIHRGTVHEGGTLVVYPDRPETRITFYELKPEIDRIKLRNPKK